MPSCADQLLPQLLMEQFDTLPIHCVHIGTPLFENSEDPDKMQHDALFVKVKLKIFRQKNTIFFFEI